MKKYIAALAVLVAANAYSAQPMFPMHVGDSWKYQADMEWTVMNSNDVKSATVDWEMTVLDVVDGPSARAVVVHGFPTGLAGYDPTEPPKQAFDVLVTRPDGFWVEHLQGEDEAAARETASKAAGGAIVGHQWLRFPLHAGDCIDDEDLNHSGSMYCWLLTARPSKSWEIAYRENSDHEFIVFEEGVGITEYTYGHHGTIASAHAVLKGRTVASPKQMHK